MEIREIRCFRINVGAGKNWLLVDVTTDSGLRGVGEAFGTGKDAATEAVIAEIAHHLEGEDPRCIIRHRDRLVRQARYPMGTPEMAAVSAVEMALWDIAGKKAGVPVFELLGGPVRNSIRVYAGGLIVPSFDDLAEGARHAASLGFNAIKLLAGDSSGVATTGAQTAIQLNEQISAIRRAVGENIAIAVDYHGRSFSPVHARAMLGALEHDLLFLEEPTLWGSIDTLLGVAAVARVPLAAGEKIVNRAQWFELISRRAVDYIQPDVAVCGGILEMVRIASAAEPQQIELAPHHASGPISLMASLHVDACVPNFFIQEWGLRASPASYHGLTSPLPGIQGGEVRLSEEAGLGIDFDPKVASELRAEPYFRPLLINPDGSIGLE